MKSKEHTIRQELRIAGFDESQTAAIHTIIDSTLDTIDKRISKVMIAILAAFTVAIFTIVYAMLKIYEFGVIPW